jgi:hypothetical protein
VADLSNALYTAQLITGNMTQGNYSAVLLGRKWFTYTQTTSLQKNISAQFITNWPSNHTRLQEKSLHFLRLLLESNSTSSSGIEPRFYGRRPRSPVTIPTELCRLGTGGTTLPILMLFQFLSITRPIIWYHVQGILSISQGQFVSKARLRTDPNYQTAAFSVKRHY